MPSKHALLSPSAAHRWLSCTPSAKLESTFPSETTSYAAEGTNAHSLAEYKLRLLLGQAITGEDAKRMKELSLDEDMDSATDFYRDIVEEELSEARAKTKDAKLFIEQELTFEGYVPESFGTSDAVIVADGELTVIDFKYGKGVMVDAKENPQLRLYALGTYLGFQLIYDAKSIKTVIVQPRLNHVDSEELTVDELLDWADSYVKPRAELAFKGEGEFNPGDHCRFCRAGATCMARAKKALDLIVSIDHDLPPLFPDEAIPAILDRADEAESWIASIRAYAQEKAVKDGVHWPGYKLVEGRTLRKITDQIAALEKLEGAGFSKEDVTNLKLKGLTELEKLVGKKKFTDLMGELIVKPQGEPTLVKESDKRPEINSIDLIFKDDITEEK